MLQSIILRRPQSRTIGPIIRDEFSNIFSSSPSHKLLSTTCSSANTRQSPTQFRQFQQNVLASSSALSTSRIGTLIDTDQLKHRAGKIRYASSPAAAYSQRVDTFPSIVIGADGFISPQGPFAEAQAQVRYAFYFLREM